MNTFASFLKTTLRSAWKNKGYNFLNIFGLAIGVACAALIFLWIEDEMEYDSVFVKKDNLYRVLENQTYEGKTRTFQSTPGPLAAAIKQEIPGIVNTARVSRKDILLSLGEKSVFEKGIYADSSLFSMFQLPFVQGNADNAMREPQSLIISETTAKKFFGGTENVIGKTLKVNAGQDFMISAILKDLPENSTLKFNWIIPFKIFADQSPFISRWGANSITTYVELAPAADVAAINKRLFDFIEKKQEGATARAFLFAMNDWHLRDKFEDGLQAGSFS
jgi:putative ABC transport system permease protein